MKLNMRPCTNGPTGGWLAQGFCCNILSELPPLPKQFLWPDTLTPEAGVRAPLQVRSSTPTPCFCSVDSF